MRKIITMLVVFLAATAMGQVTTIPSPAEANAPVTLRFNKTGTPLASYNGTIYCHMGVTVDGVQWSNVIGGWGQDGVQPAMTLVSGSTYELVMGPDLYTYFGVPQTSTITQICVVFRASAAQNSTPQSADYFVNIGAFQLNLTSPAQNSVTLLASGGSLNIAANNTGGNASYNLMSNGVSINSNPATANYSFNHTNITANQNYELVVTQGSSTITKKFSVVVNPGALTQAMPAGLNDGVNYSADHTKATLVLNAPFKDFVYVAGSFNNWQPGSAHAMKKDPTTGKFWLEVTGLTSGEWYSYQYWVGDQTSLPANSPALVKTADPFSTLVLSPFDDPEIHQLGVYPGLPQYPAGQEREVSVIQTGPNAYYNYNWSEATTNFVKPPKKDLVIYEVLVRDFDADRSYQNLIDRIQYFKDLKINAIQLMPVMEFEGNESWGYNTVFHMALDKRYGPPAKLKEFVDLCHQNGIAVILDVALNHVYGRSPLERMWMLDSDGDGWANGTGPRVSTENPYCNATARHSYNVGTDLNHFREPDNLTNYYTLRTIQHWINEYKIDGFRWDLTKGFTQNCPFTGSGSAQDACTNGYQADRVGKLKWYADAQWAIDPNFYVIFEHLGNGGSYDEEVEWANYRLTGEPDGISKGIMQWRKMTDPYANFLKGNSADLTGVAHPTHRFVGYAESHDEERVIYKALTEAGQTQNNLAKAHARMSALGAAFFLVPGPKMIYHFGDLGYEGSIFTCSNGTVNTPTDATSGDCKLDTKPQPQWVENWLANTARRKIYDDWAKMIELKRQEPVFENGTYTFNTAVNGRARLVVQTSATPTANLSHVIAMTNATNSVYAANFQFPYTGTWYDLMTGTPVTVTNVNQTINIEVDGFKIFGNALPSLANEHFQPLAKLQLYPNPANNSFVLNADVVKVQVYSMTGQLVKSFDAGQIGTEYDITDLSQGLYLVKAIDAQNAEKTLRLVKQ